MRFCSLILILVSIDLIHSSRLSESENEQRLNLCGKKTNSKVYKGKAISQAGAPWSVHILNSKGECTGSVVSSRHIFFATHCINELGKNILNEITLGVWRKHDPELLVQIINNCERDDYVITDPSILSKVKIKSNGKPIAVNVEKITLIKKCDEKRSILPDADDIAIIHLREDLKFSDTLQPVCVASDVSENANNTKLYYYGYGTNPPKGGSTDNAPSGKLLYEQTVIFYSKPDYHYFQANNPTHKSITCPGDSGGGAIANNNGRETIVGVLSKGNCRSIDQRETNPVEVYVSVGYYSETICELTGICSSSQGNNLNFIFIRVVLITYFLLSQ